MCAKSAWWKAEAAASTLERQAPRDLTTELPGDLRGFRHTGPAGHKPVHEQTSGRADPALQQQAHQVSRPGDQHRESEAQPTSQHRSHLEVPIHVREERVVEL